MLVYLALVYRICPLTYTSHSNCERGALESLSSWGPYGAVPLLKEENQPGWLRVFGKDVRELMHRGTSLSSHSVGQPKRDVRCILLGSPSSLFIYQSFYPLTSKPQIFRSFSLLPPYIFTKYIWLHRRLWGVNATETELPPSEKVLSREDGLKSLSLFYIDLFYGGEVPSNVSSSGCLI